MLSYSGAEDRTDIVWWRLEDYDVKGLIVVELEGFPTDGCRSLRGHVRVVGKTIIVVSTDFV